MKLLTLGQTVRHKEIESMVFTVHDIVQEAKSNGFVRIISVKLRKQYTGDTVYEVSPRNLVKYFEVQSVQWGPINL